MNEQQRAVVQQALWVVRELMDGEHTYEALERADNAIFALRQLLEQPVQEPVAWCWRNSKGWITYGESPHDYFDSKPLYTTPPAQLAVPLTDEQTDLLINGRGEHGDDDYVEPTGDGFGLTDEDLVKLIRRVEAHHGIGVKP